MSADIEFLVTCSVCLCDYDDESRKQKFLPCLHSFCQSCVTVSEKRNKLSIFKKSINSDILVLITVHIQQVKQFGRIKCPICRCEVRLLSGDVSTLPDTYFGCLREMEMKMKEIQLKEKEKARKIEEMKQEQEEMKREKEKMKQDKEKTKQEKEKMKQEKEELKRIIAQQGGKINQLRWSNNRLAADCDELEQVKQQMEIVVVAKNQQISSLNEIVTAKKLEEAQNQKRPDETQAARTEDLYYSDPEDILLQNLVEDDEENELRDLEETFSNQQLEDHEEIDELINQELRDHQEDMEEFTNHEFKYMYEFGEDFCDSMF